MMEEAFFMFDDSYDEHQDSAATATSAPARCYAKMSELTRIVERLQLLSTPCNDFGRKIHQAVSEAIPRYGTETSSLAVAMATMGFDVVVRKGNRDAIRGVQMFSCLRHEFLVVRGTSGELKGVEFIVEPSLRQHFSIPHASSEYEFILNNMPDIFVGSSCRLVPVVQLLCALMADSFRREGLTLPPWRRDAAMLSKWLPQAQFYTDYVVDRSVLPMAPVPAAVLPVAVPTPIAAPLAAIAATGAAATAVAPVVKAPTHRFLGFSAAAEELKDLVMLQTSRRNSTGSESSSSCSSGGSDCVSPASGFLSVASSRLSSLQDYVPEESAASTSAANSYVRATKPKEAWCALPARSSGRTSKFGADNGISGGGAAPCGLPNYNWAYILSPEESRAVRPQVRDASDCLSFKNFSQSAGLEGAIRRSAAGSRPSACSRPSVAASATRLRTRSLLSEQFRVARNSPAPGRVLIATA
ncbi:hypothetical protein Vretimale_1969 [Volvox reticuliferus]|uniref:Uncharacterized protein n=1 Tax=Volvox reticuliferus TaxID=1737510 RepID=A0A8J4C2I0_9CHLO|nr:hypothetical protein Vretifemale_4233 [Volvox reticuliferus]GIL96085.1 hypothetical protein Vretimale_1969 [Volvox reticuliferus]